LLETQAVVERRIAELRTLKSEGFPIQFVSRWHARVGWLHIWIAAGRWHNIATGERGRINKRMMRELIAPIFEPMIERGSQLCPEQEHRARQERRRHQEFVMQHKEYMNAMISWTGRSNALPRPNHLSACHLQRHNFVGGFAP
jgi:hypothetical protein